MIRIVIAVGAVILLAPVAWLVRTLTLRVVGVKPRRKVITARCIGDEVELPRTVLTTAAGDYGLWFGDGFRDHALVGAVVHSDGEVVVRRLLESTAPVPTEPFPAQWTGHVMHSPAQIDRNWEDVTIPLRDGTSAPAWLFPGHARTGAWVIHVQGIRTSRLVTLRSVEVAQRAGLTSLAITYRGAGDGPAATVSNLGQREWSDLADAIAYARTHGASEVHVVAWSMGAGLALELLRRDPRAFDSLVLIAPATNWKQIIRHGLERGGLPGFFAPVVTYALASRILSRVIGAPAHSISPGSTGAGQMSAPSRHSSCTPKAIRRSRSRLRRLTPPRSRTSRWFIRKRPHTDGRRTLTLRCFSLRSDHG